MCLEVDLQAAAGLRLNAGSVRHQEPRGWLTQGRQSGPRHGERLP